MCHKNMIWLKINSNNATLRELKKGQLAASLECGKQNSTWEVSI